eukprot:128925-Prymnesium_polylepis.1
MCGQIGTRRNAGEQGVTRLDLNYRAVLIGPERGQPLPNVCHRVGWLDAQYLSDYGRDSRLDCLTVRGKSAEKIDGFTETTVTRSRPERGQPSGDQRNKDEPGGGWQQP